MPGTIEPPSRVDPRETSAARRLLAPHAMRLLRSAARLAPLLFSTSGCLGSTVVGEGPPDRDADDERASAEEVQRVLAGTTSTGALFECTFESGQWTGANDGTRLRVTRSGAFVSVGGRSLRIDRVDKSGPHSSYVSYWITSGATTLRVEGSIGGGQRRPMYLYLSGPANESCICAERIYGEGDSGVFDDAELDSLVTVTNGRR